MKLKNEICTTFCNEKFTFSIIQLFVMKAFIILTVFNFTLFIKAVNRIMEYI